MKKIIVGILFIGLPLSYYIDGKHKKLNGQISRSNHMKLASESFDNNRAIPTKFTCEGKNISPELHWSAIPDGTQSLALICDDPDAPRDEPWVHWVLYNMPPTLKKLKEGIVVKDILKGTHEGKNDFGDLGYGGPCPPKGHGIHRYIFTLYILDIKLNLQEGATKNEVLQAMQGHVLDKTQLIGLYERI